MTAAKSEKMTLEQAARANPGIGRRKLMELTGLTGYACARFLKGVPGKPRTGGPAKPQGPENPAGVTAIALHNTRVLDSKPASDNVKKQLYGLRKGMGYPVAALADQWGISEETLRRHAKKLGCLKYVETGPGDWTHCILHPDTAEDYRKD